ncbi:MULTISPECIES: sensor histidine kinase [unclassified Sphingobium]|uniref:sensor histidine kinase n=1 Tax=unclassified Sphingobium TaxID=2611147 RepID=UPI0022248167|nr:MULTISPECIES: histidine kinase dimerization/phospho-acceptor domain-containing protein [unclassified Sphingobium]MCW2412170.1 signal transduction histidine kinase [Sphingobium sp. B8D3D]MCW2415533.1 signal transduction histidine kinase [Sphingobium sp. B8D3A]
MRFNDLLRTVLANGGEGTGAAVTRWRQCMDLLAQYDVSGVETQKLSPDEAHTILTILQEARPKVSLEGRIASVVELGSRLRSPTLVQWLAGDHPSVVVAMMKSVRLTGEDWAAIIPHLGPLARSVLRRRPDLPDAAMAALRRFGEVDLSLPAVEVRQAEAETSSADRVVATEELDRPGSTDEASQIGRLVAQIERFKKANPFKAAGAADPRPDAVQPESRVQNTPDADVDSFQFETDASGLVRLTDGAFPEAIIGLSIATPGVDVSHGVDGATLGAFRHRAAFENSRLTLQDGALAGEWRISGEPHFDRQSGRFRGYTGIARRERRFEAPVRPIETQASDEGATLSATSTRQLIHELRTPLNAVQGYGEMIEAQILGPVPEVYRDIARAILADARALLTTFDDLDAASRLERGDLSAQQDDVDLTAALHRVVDAAGFGQAVNLSVESGSSLVHGDRNQIERMLNHLIRIGHAGLAAGEQLVLCVCPAPERASVSLTMSRPTALRGIEARAFLEQGYVVEQRLYGDTPPLGLAFTLKLVRGIVRHLGGEFAITAQAFGIVLPTAPEAYREQGHNG